VTVRILRALSLILLVPVVACEASTAPRGGRAAYVYQIPEGFRGWVKVEYSSPGCPALEDREGGKLIEVSRAGTACTKYDRSGGWKSSAFRYGAESPRLIPEAPASADNGCCQPAVLPKGQDPATVFVWGQTGWTCESPKAEVQVFFVGAVDEYNKNRDDYQKFACDASPTSSP